MVKALITLNSLSAGFYFHNCHCCCYFKVERKNAQRVKTDKTGTFDSTNILKFYDERIVFENEALNSKGELKYDQFYSLVESKDYFIFI